MEELQEKFSLERVTKSAAVFDKEKLSWMNGDFKSLSSRLFESMRYLQGSI